MHRSTLLAVAAALALATWAPPGRASSSGDELVRQARTHEAAHDDDVAVRRYMEALEIDPVNEDAWLGLGALRMRIGEAAEAERVFDAALQRVPTLHRAIQGRAHARWAQGRHGDAEGDLEAYTLLEHDADALRELSGWYGTDGRTPAQLAVWRRLLTMASDDAGQREARRMVRALVILVDKADPASSPVEPDAARRAMAAVARRGG
ncbi:MAG TPA: tetratricopeptide repeat protein [Polyangiaceae bacterium]